jgi:hypothetical protein
MRVKLFLDKKFHDSYEFTSSKAVFGSIVVVHCGRHRASHGQDGAGVGVVVVGPVRAVRVQGAQLKM